MQRSPAEPVVSKEFLRAWRVLLLLTVGLMALGAGVRAMNAGLACPDWPLCFGQIIPDFHVGVYFEFIHRAYAGLVALMFFGGMWLLIRNPRVPRLAKALGWFAVVVLLSQIVMGGLTVLKLLKSGIVTAHLLLATVFLATLLWIHFLLSPAVERRAMSAPAYLPIVAGLLPALIFSQILLGGLVASTYAGVVCVDFPLCNGQWIPTLKGPIGLQVMHRLGAYFITAFTAGFAAFMYKKRSEQWMSAQLCRLAFVIVAIVCAQVMIGAANVLLFVPASVTVLHQLMAMLALGAGLRLYFVARELAAVRMPVQYEVNKMTLNSGVAN